MQIGDTVRKITMARFTRTLSTLVAAGVDIIRAIEITGPDLAATMSSKKRWPRRHDSVCTRVHPFRSR